MKLRARYRSSSQHDESWIISYADLVTNLLLFFVTLVGASQISTLSKQRVASSFRGGQTTSSSLISLNKDLKSKIDDSGLSDAFSVELKKEGLSLSFDSGVVFGVGESEVLPQWRESLEKLIHVILPYKDQYNIAIEGHTDSLPIRHGSVFASNWELGFARAENIRTWLENSGVNSRKMRVESYADTINLPGGDQEQQRRVVVRLF